jgi:predicted transcriptional regulator
MDEQGQPDETSLNDWQVEEIKKGLIEADLNEFATDEEVRDAINRYKCHQPI